MFVLDQSSKTIINLSKSIIQTLGYEPMDLLNKNLFDIIHKYDRNTVESSLFENEKRVAIARFLMKSQASTDQEQFKTFYLTSHQITENQNFSVVIAKLIDDNPNKNLHGFIRCNISGKLIAVHPKLIDLLGLTGKVKFCVTCVVCVT
jgi:light-regulated signal transduction histidine kinase (bacteriophytochrome)